MQFSVIFHDHAKSSFLRILQEVIVPKVTVAPPVIPAPGPVVINIPPVILTPVVLTAPPVSAPLPPKVRPS